MNFKELYKIIPYLASKFTHALFKRLHINLRVGNWFDGISGINDHDFDKYKSIYPKHIDITPIKLNMNRLKFAL